MESKYVLEPVVRTVTSLDDPEQRLLIFGETGQTMLGMLIVFALLAGIGVLLVAAFCAAGNHASDRVKDMCGRIFYRVRHVCRKYAWLLLSFIIPFVIMLAAYARIGIFPFGDYTILTNDAIHQYLPFFTELHEKLANGESLFYSFCAGLGYNFWAVIAYYLVSPWNMLVVFVPVNHVVDFMSYLILFKISMSGAVFAWYLSKRKGGNDFSVVIFSCMWALNAFLIGYSYNIMRLDSIMILPYVMYGIERLVSHKSGKMFTLALFYGIVCNYYIGYMLCIFSCLYFLCVCMMKHHRLIDFVKSGFQFMWHGLLAGGMGMVLLIPAYKALQLTISAGEQAGSWRSLLGSIEIYGSSFDQLIKHFSLTGVVTLSDLQSDVNLYCGVIVLPLVLLFVLDRNIHIRERITKIVLCLFLLLSMNVNVLGFIWHGFHEQYGIPNRFAFLYITMALIMGFDVFHDITSLPMRRIAAVFGVSILLVVICWLCKSGGYEDYVYIANIAMLLCYSALLTGICMCMRADMRKTLQLILMSVMLIEITFNGISNVLFSGCMEKSRILGDQESIQAFLSEKEDEYGFFRSDTIHSNIYNENVLVGSYGVKLFSSLMPESVLYLWNQLGIGIRANTMMCDGITKLVSDVFGIRYMATVSNENSQYRIGSMYGDTLY